MSEFAFMRFMSNNMLTTEESQHKDEIVDLTEQVLDAKGLECDERISKLSEEKLREILEEVRKLRNRRKKRKEDNLTEELLYVR
ncbi:MAG: hypothetical protein ACJ71M_05975 [Nitrososphaeraceae archaeon]